MNLGQSLLEGEAESWFYSQKRSIFRSWEHLIDLLIWWFGDCNEFGDFIDPELFRLWDKNDRILQARRVEKMRKRMKATSIPEKVTIWDTETEALIPTDTIPVINLTESRDSISATKLIQEANSTPVMDGGVSFEKEISCQAVEYIHTLELFSAKESMENAESSSAKDDSITQTQVPVSSLEPGLSFSSEIIDVSVAWPSEMVSHNRMHSQAAFECVKNKNNAHPVLDEMLLRQHKFQQRKKPSFSPKSRMFKFKNRTKLSNWSQMDLHQVIDISKVNNMSLCVSANFGLVRKTRTFQCLRFKKQAHKSRVQYHLRRLHDPGGNKDEHSDAIFETEVDMDNVQRTPMDTVAVSVTTTPDTVASSSNAVAPSTDVITERQRWDEAGDAEIDALEGTGTYIVTSLPANKIPIGCKWLLQLILDGLKSHLRHKWKFEVAAYSLSFDVDTEDNISSGLSPTSQVWEPGGVLAEHVLVDWLVDCNGYVGTVDDIRCLALGVCSGINQPIDSRRASRVWERGGVDMSTALTAENDIMRLGWMVFDRGKNNIISGDVITPLMNAWYSCQQQETTSAESSSAVQRDDEVSVVLQQGIIADSVEDTREETVVVEESAISEPEAAAVVDVRCDDMGRRKLLINWQAHDAFESSWLFSMAFVQSYHAFKLEDKLVFGEGSIDTIKQSYCRRKREESVSSKAREVSLANGGFAENN